MGQAGLSIKTQRDWAWSLSGAHEPTLQCSAACGLLSRMWCNTSVESLSSPVQRPAGLKNQASLPKILLGSPAALQSLARFLTSFTS